MKFLYLVSVLTVSIASLVSAGNAAGVEEERYVCFLGSHDAYVLTDPGAGSAVFQDGDERLVLKSDGEAGFANEDEAVFFNNDPGNPILKLGEGFFPCAADTV